MPVKYFVPCVFAFLLGAIFLFFPELLLKLECWVFVGLFLAGFCSNLWLDYTSGEGMKLKGCHFKECMFHQVNCNGWFAELKCWLKSVRD